MIARWLGALLFSVAAAGGAQAEGFISEVRAGVAAQSCCGPAADKEQGVGINADVLFESPRFLHVLYAPRPVVGGSVASDSDATSYVHFGLNWEFDIAPRIFFGATLGGAVHNGEADPFVEAVDSDRMSNTHFYGCRALFRGAGDLGVRMTDRISVMATWSHMSNAGLCADNEALDQLGVRVGLIF